MSKSDPGAVTLKSAMQARDELVAIIRGTDDEGERAAAFEDLRRMDEALAKVVSAIPEESGWISVKDRLPEVGKHVLVVVDVDGERAVTLAVWDGKGWECVESPALLRIAPPVYWMLKPDPPDSFVSPRNHST